MTELLAPVGSWDALVAAVESGAQAVYLGGRMFGARYYAQNFTDEEMAKAVRYAHLHSVSVYVTVNILIDSGEMEELAAYLQMLYSIGVDAILVQDLAVAKLARQVAPDLPLHASTQMTIHNLAGVQFLAELGFQRVVLARELSLEEIRYICKNSPVEIEVFIHGALCVCYSGQCLMSSLIGGRSGNRGKCAQPCRLPYHLVDEQGNDVLAGKDAGNYLLSPRDLNTLELLPELVESGVASLKIEGRMKRPEYVAVVVNTYRRALDRVLAAQAETVDAAKAKAAQHDLAQVFNRDFTTAFLLGKQGRNMMSDRRPNNRGLRAGRVLEYHGRDKEAVIQLHENLAIGDIIEVWVKVGGRVNVTIEKILRDGQAISEAEAGETVTVNMPSFVKAGDRVFKTFDVQLMERARSFFARPEELHRFPVDVQVTVELGKPLTIEMVDDEGHHGRAETKFLAEQARNRPLSRESIQKQVERLGTTGFCLRKLTVLFDGELMVPVSEINEARRQAVESLEENRLQKYARPELPQGALKLPAPLPTLQSAKQKLKLTVHVDRLDQVTAAVEAGADMILLGGECYGHRAISAAEYRKAVTAVHSAGKKIVFATPRLVKEWQTSALQREFSLFQELKPDAVAVGNVGVYYLLKNTINLPFEVDSSLNTFNKAALDFWASRSATCVTLSPELNFTQIEKLAAAKSVPIECIVQGRLEMMISEYCVLGSFLGNLAQGECTKPCLTKQYYLKDRLNALFPVMTDPYCRMHILNSKRLSMIPHVPRLAEAGVDRIRIEAKDLDAAEIRQITKIYRELIDQGSSHPALVNGRIEELEPADMTRGHYFRGVL